MAWAAAPWLSLYSRRGLPATFSSSRTALSVIFGSAMTSSPADRAAHVLGLGWTIAHHRDDALRPLQALLVRPPILQGHALLGHRDIGIGAILNAGIGFQRDVEEAVGVFVDRRLGAIFFRDSVVDTVD